MDKYSIQAEMTSCSNRQEQCLQEIQMNAKKLETVIAGNERIRTKYKGLLEANNWKTNQIKNLSKAVFNADMLAGLQETIIETYQGKDFTNAVSGYENAISKMNWCREKLEEDIERLQMELKMLQQRMDCLNYQLHALQEE